MKKILVFGASGFVGSHIVHEFAKLSPGAGQTPKTAPDKESSTQPSLVRGNFTLIGVSRDSKRVRDALKNVRGPHADALRQAQWETCDPINRDDIAALLERHPETTAIVSCIGGFGKSEEAARKVNGPPNVNVVHAVCQNKYIEKFVYISAAQLFNPNLVRMMRGYYNGKLSVEHAMSENLGERGLMLQPGIIYGRRRVGNFEVPLGVVGVPIECVTMPIYKRFGWKLCTPPINVHCVAKCALLGCFSSKISDTDASKCLSGKIDTLAMHQLVSKYHVNEEILKK